MVDYIEFTGVTKAFDDQVVLDGVTFGVQTGTTFAILGPSGVGKSVLLNHVVGFLAPDAGDVRVAGRNLRGMTDRELSDVRKKVQLVFQSGALFDSLTVWENVAFPLADTGLGDETVEERVAEKLRLVEVEHLADKMPSELSTGMKRAVAIARALAAEPDAILYDEPTTMVDPLLSATINNLIKKMQLQLGLTQMVVTHDIANCAEKVADRVALLHRGRFVFNGTIEELYRSDDPVVREFVDDDSYRVERDEPRAEASGP